MVPLIDVLMVLIIFFLVTMQFKDLRALNVKLPKIETAGSNLTKNELIISVSKNGLYTVDSQKVSIDKLQKIFSYPIYLCLMTLLASIIMFYLKKNQNSTLKISFGLFLSVVIYYLNNFLYVLGKTEKINIILSVWAPLLILMIINSIYIFKINEK